MKRKTTILLLVAIGVILALTNPPVENHKEAAKQKLYKQSDPFTVTQADLDSFATVGYALSDGAIFSVVDSLVEDVSRDNYVFFSLTRVQQEDNSEIIGAGVLKNVFITDKLQLKQEAQEKASDQN